jgi:hypothetical protein
VEYRPCVPAVAASRRENVVPTEQIPPETFICTGNIEITVRGCNDVNIDLEARLPPKALEFSLRQHVQNSPLRIRREFANLIEKDRPAVGKLETHSPSQRGSRERSITMPELFGNTKHATTVAQLTATNSTDAIRDCW